MLATASNSSLLAGLLPPGVGWALNAAAVIPYAMPRVKIRWRLWAWLASLPAWVIALSATAGALLCGMLIGLWLWRRRVREAFIRETLLPPGLLDTLSIHFPALSLKDRQLVARGLRKFFLAQLKARRQPLTMPSRVVGTLWTAFAQRGAAYEAYCQRSLGRMLPAQPREAADVEDHQAGVAPVDAHGGVRVLGRRHHLRLQRLARRPGRAPL